MCLWSTVNMYVAESRTKREKIENYIQLAPYPYFSTPKTPKQNSSKSIMIAIWIYRLNARAKGRRGTKSRRALNSYRLKYGYLLCLFYSFVCFQFYFSWKSVFFPFVNSFFCFALLRWLHLFVRRVSNETKKNYNGDRHFRKLNLWFLRRTSFAMLCYWLAKCIEKQANALTLCIKWKSRVCAQSVLFRFLSFIWLFIACELIRSSLAAERVCAMMKHTKKMKHKSN